MEQIKIIENTPWTNSGNLAEAYSEFMDKLEDDEWALFRDADTIFTTSDYGKQFYDVLNRYKGVRCFTGLTNRINCAYQKVGGIHNASDDMRYHRDIGKAIQKEKYGEAIDVTDMQLMSGFFILIKKSLWKELGKLEVKGMLGVDNEIHQRIRIIGERLYLMKGVYLYHWYKGSGETERNTDHLKPQ